MAPYQPQLGLQDPWVHPGSRLQLAMAIQGNSTYLWCSWDYSEVQLWSKPPCLWGCNLQLWLYNLYNHSCGTHINTINTTYHVFHHILTTIYIYIYIYIYSFIDTPIYNPLRGEAAGPRPLWPSSIATVPCWSDTTARSPASSAGRSGHDFFGINYNKVI